MEQFIKYQEESEKKDVEVGRATDENGDRKGGKAVKRRA